MLATKKVVKPLVIEKFDSDGTVDEFSLIDDLPRTASAHKVHRGV